MSSAASVWMRRQEGRRGGSSQSWCLLLRGGSYREAKLHERVPGSLQWHLGPSDQMQEV